MEWPSIRDEVLESAKKIEAVAHELPPEEAQKLRAEVDKKFTSGRESRWIWEDLLDFVGCDDPESWRWVDNFIGDTKVLIMFDPEEEKTIFEFAMELVSCPP